MPKVGLSLYHQEEARAMTPGAVNNFQREDFGLPLKQYTGNRLGHDIQKDRFNEDDLRKVVSLQAAARPGRGLQDLTGSHSAQVHLRAKKETTRPAEMAKIFMDSAQDAQIHYKVSQIIHGSNYGHKEFQPLTPSLHQFFKRENKKSQSKMIS
jgi:hypothetical protein